MKEYTWIPLNIVMTYPVHWNKYQVLRDFVQNFYDSVGYREWKEKFHYFYDNNKLSMWVDGISFSYEWLLHIGASTKTSNSNDFAGYFGEGFKIAALCGYRDFGWEIQMMSDDWNLVVTSLEHSIENTTVEMLSYGIRRKAKEERSCLILEHILPHEYETFCVVLESFYYPENEIMSTEIFANKDCAVYLRSSQTINPLLPVTRDYGRKGAVFCGYQMLGTNPFNLVVCLHKYKKEDRERRGLYAFEVIDVFEEVCRFVDSKCAMIILEKMRRYWNSYPQKHIDINSWSGVVDRLIYKISESQEISQFFVQKHNNLLCLPRLHSVYEKNQRGQARAWLSQQRKKYLLVKGTFARLGYPTIEQECERNGGFISDEEVNSLQKQAFDVLEKLCKRIFSGFFILDQWPVPKKISNPRAAYHGMAVVYKKKNSIINNKGIKIRYDVGKIYLKQETLEQKSYYDALSTYIHELCHMFGGDASESFGLALTYAMEILMKNHDVVLCGQEEWNHIFS